MFVEATKDDKLLKMFKDTEEKYKVSEEFRIKFVPKSGVKLKDLITKKIPSKTPVVLVIVYLV